MRAGEAGKSEFDKLSGTVSPKPKRQRKPTLAGALKQADKMGKQVNAATIGADGVTLHFVEPETIQHAA
jgi:hypothetical protein